MEHNQKKKKKKEWNRFTKHPKLTQYCKSSTVQKKSQKHDKKVSNNYF